MAAHSPYTAWCCCTLHAPQIPAVTWCIMCIEAHNRGTLTPCIRMPFTRYTRCALSAHFFVCTSACCLDSMAFCLTPRIARPKLDANACGLVCGVAAAAACCPKRLKDLARAVHCHSGLHGLPMAYPWLTSVTHAQGSYFSVQMLLRPIKRTALHTH